MALTITEQLEPQKREERLRKEASEKAEAEYKKQVKVYEEQKAVEETYGKEVTAYRAAKQVVLGGKPPEPGRTPVGYHRWLKKLQSAGVGRQVVPRGERPMVTTVEPGKRGYVGAVLVKPEPTPLKKTLIEEPTPFEKTKLGRAIAERKKTMIPPEPTVTPFKPPAWGVEYTPIGIPKLPGIKRAEYEISKRTERIYQREPKGIFREIKAIPLGVVAYGTGIIGAVARPTETVKGIKYTITHPLEVGAEVGRKISAEPGFVTGEVTGMYLTGKAISYPIRRYAVAKQLKTEVGKLPVSKQIQFKRLMAETKKITIQPKVKELKFGEVQYLPKKGAPAVSGFVKRKPIVIGGRVAEHAQLYAKPLAMPHDIDIYVRGLAQQFKSERYAGQLARQLTKAGVKRVSMPKPATITIAGKKAIEFHPYKTYLRPNIEQVMPKWKPAAFGITKTPSGVKVLKQQVQWRRMIVRGFLEKPEALARATRIKESMLRVGGLRKPRKAPKISPPIIQKHLRIPKPPIKPSTIIRRGRKITYPTYKPYPSYKPYIPFAVSIPYKPYKPTKAKKIISYKPYKPSKIITPYVPAKVSYPSIYPPRRKAPYKPYKPYKPYAPSVYFFPSPKYPGKVKELKYPFERRAKPKKKFIKVRQPQAYQPTLAAGILGIKAKKPKPILGKFKFGYLPGIRPLIK